MFRVKHQNPKFQAILFSWIAFKYVDKKNTWVCYVTECKNLKSIPAALILVKKVVSES